jgi:hypothetical protein
MLQEITIGIEDLLLDPNNPRFVHDLSETTEIPDDQVPDLQAETLKKFDRHPTATDDEDIGVINISDLYDSMRRIGFVGIDHIVVRPLNGPGKYLVIEGNRRIATAQSILRDFEGKAPPLDKPSVRQEVEGHLDSMKNITVMLLNIEGLTKATVAHNVAVIMGIRHHGSVLEWEPLPKAYNIYTEYMDEDPAEAEFTYLEKKARAVANRLCIQVGDVRRALRTYVAYLQVRDRFPEVRDDHFSLIEYNVFDKVLSRSYYQIDEDTFELDEKSLGKLNTVCQFASRDSNKPDCTTDNKKKIIRDPKQVKLLGRLVAAAVDPDTAIKEYSRDLIKRVEDENDPDITLEGAVDSVSVLKKRIQWVSALSDLLKNQESKLTLDSYNGEGIDRGRKDELRATLEPISRILGL